jgi:predicted esterase
VRAYPIKAKLHQKQSRISKLSNIPTTIKMANQTESRRSKKSTSAHYPDLLIKAPRSGFHRQTFILLHGRGSEAPSFGPTLLATPIPDFGNLAKAFPDAKFIFPTASRRRAQLYKRSTISQWFDNWTHYAPEEREELQNDGLRETSSYLHGLLRKEVGLVGASNVVLGGLSQGCAASLAALLLWEGEPLAAAVGMCGYLPYRKKMEDIIHEERLAMSSENEGGADDIFERAPLDESSPSGEVEVQALTTSKPGTSPAREAVQFLRNEIEFSKTGAAAWQPTKLGLQDIPVFLGHGTEDRKVEIDLGRSAAGCLEAMDIDVAWKEYPDLGHWYSGDMLRDLVIFLRAHTDWKRGEDQGQ